MLGLVLHICSFGTGGNPGTNVHWDISEALSQQAAAKNKLFIHSLVQNHASKLKVNSQVGMCAPASIPVVSGSDTDENGDCIPKVVDAFFDGDNISVTLSCDTKQSESNGPIGQVHTDRSFICSCTFSTFGEVPLRAVVNGRGYSSMYHHHCKVPPSLEIPTTVQGKVCGAIMVYLPATKLLACVRVFVCLLLFIGTR